MSLKDVFPIRNCDLYKLIIKQKEVDGRKELSDDEILGVLTKMVKQRKESISQFTAANRQDLADKEAAEIEVLQAFMPQPLSDAEVDALIDATLQQLAVTSPQEMGKVMNALRPQLQGRADMGVVSAKIKARLA